MADQKSNLFLNSLYVPFVIIVVLWAIQVFQQVTGFDLGAYGVLPRSTVGVRGIFTSPFIHGDYGHLLSNTPPLFVLTFVVLYFYRKVAFPSILMIYVLTGLAVWIFGRKVFHIGASGVIYGLVAFVFWNGIFRRNIKSIVLALIVVFYYGSMFVGIFPGQEGISWESHLLGAIVGIFTSYWFKDSIERDENKPTYSWEVEPENPPKPFLDPDAFDQTKEQRRRDQLGRDDSSIWFSNRT